MNSRTKVIAGVSATALLAGGVIIGATLPSSGTADAGMSPQQRTAASELTRDRAREIAAGHVSARTGQPARASWAGRENDHGARWEVEVTSGGREFDVYVASSGEVVHVKAKGQKRPAVKKTPVDRRAAARAARVHMQREFGMPARVTWTGREDDFGARWEIEVTLADGREFDVYVGPGIRILRVV